MEEATATTEVKKIEVFSCTFAARVETPQKTQNNNKQTKGGGGGGDVFLWEITKELGTDSLLFPY